MKTYFLLATSLSISLLAAGCTETSGAIASAPATSVSVSGKNAQEIALEKEVNALQKQTRDIVARNTVEGAIVGAAAGCAIGLLLGGDGDDCLAGAAVGAVAGGVGGNAVGRAAAEKNKELVKQDQILANLKGINASLGSVNSRLSAVLAAQNSEVASLKRQLDGEQISNSVYESRVRAINSNRSAVIKGLGAAEQDVAKSRSELVGISKESGQSYPALQTAAKSTETRLKTLRSSVNLIPTS